MGKVITRGADARVNAISIIRNGGTLREAAAATGYGEDYVRQLATKAGAWVQKSHKGINKQKILAESKRERKKKLHEEMAAYKKVGHSIKEVAERFDVSEGTVLKYCKGIAPQTQRKPKTYKNQFTGIDQTDRVIAVIKERHPEVEYVGNYTGSNGTADVMCVACGHVMTKSWVTIRHGGAIVCDECVRTRQERRAKERELEKAMAVKAFEANRERRWFSRKAEQISMKTCPVCMSLFVPEHGVRQKYCSGRCSKKVANQHGKDRRLKLLKDRVIDSDITLEGVAKRDNGTCWLCGKSVEWDDYTENDGVFIAGDAYPSIDHVIPLAKGGLHEWDNVRLSHRRCNYLKRDDLHTSLCEKGRFYDEDRCDDLEKIYNHISTSFDRS